MTFSRLVPSTSSVSSWRLGHIDPDLDRVQLGIGSCYAHLDVEDADSLGRYLLTAADTIKANRANRLDVPTSAL